MRRITCLFALFTVGCGSTTGATTADVSGGTTDAQLGDAADVVDVVDVQADAPDSVDVQPQADVVDTADAVDAPDVLDVPEVPDVPETDTQPPPLDAASDAAGGKVDDPCGEGQPECAAGLVCCYPCGIPGCQHKCAVPCTDAWCQGGCPLLP